MMCLSKQFILLTKLVGAKTFFFYFALILQMLFLGRVYCYGFHHFLLEQASVLRSENFHVIMSQAATSRKDKQRLLLYD